MLWPFRPRMVECRCLACGHTWMLKAALAHNKRSARRRRGGLSAGGMGLAADHIWEEFGGGVMELQPAVAHQRDAPGDQELEMLKQLRSCPRCGSERYTL
jgi:hypothetical protein